MPNCGQTSQVGRFLSLVCCLLIKDLPNTNDYLKFEKALKRLYGYSYLKYPLCG